MQNASIQPRLTTRPLLVGEVNELGAKIRNVPSPHRHKLHHSRLRRMRQYSRSRLKHPDLFDASDVMPLQNRLRIIALHVPWYGFRTQARLARDSGISRAAVSRLIRHQVQPSLSVALRLTRVLSMRLERPLDVWEVFSLDGTYPTDSVCELCGCRSCSLGTKALLEQKKVERENARSMRQQGTKALLEQKKGNLKGGA